MNDTGYINSWQGAEENALGWMCENGFGDARPTAGGADGGIDVRSKAGLAQVKFEAHQVGRPAIQRLVGARGHGDQVLLFFTGTGYSKTARDYADDLGVALFTYDPTGAVSPVNGAASQLAGGGGPNIPAGRPAREIWGFVLVLLGAAVFINTVVQTVKAISGNGLATWDWYDPFWVLPIAFAFMTGAWLLLRTPPPLESADNTDGQVSG